MEKFFHTLKSRLARRIGLYVILASTILSIFTSGFQIYAEFKREETGVYNILDQIEKTHLQNIAARVWVLDSFELENSLSNLLELSSIQYVAVYEEDKILVSVGNDIEKNAVNRDFPLIYRANNVNNVVGHLVVKASLDEIYQNVFDRAVFIILSNLIKTFIVAIFILFIFYKLVTRHLSDISSFLLDKHSLTETQNLTLDRNDRKGDELDQLVDTINNMQKNLNQQFDEINQQKQHLSQTLNSIGDAVISTDVKGNVVRMNPVAERLTGISNEDAAGQTIKSVFPIINATTNEEIENPIEKVMQNGEIVHLSNHTTLVSKNGVQYQIADSAAPIKNEHGKILGMVLVFNDVTEQYKLREEAKLNARKYRTLATVAPVGLFYTDVQGHCLYVNEKWSQTAGMSLRDAMGEGWTKAIHPEDVDKVTYAWNQLSEKGIPFKLEYRFEHGKNIRWVLGQTLAEQDSNGKIIGYVGTITDITERKIAEEALSRSQKMDALGKLTGGIAHDYNNMLGVILGYAELLKDKVQDEPVLVGFVDQIYDAGHRGAKLTRKLLSFSRQRTTDSEILNINTILLGEQNMLVKTLTVSIKLTLELEENIWMINVDSSDLENAVLNLCINASHAMAGNGELILKTENINIEGKKFVCLSICDTGCGLDAEEKEKIFDPFYTTKGDGGTGLGLSQVYGFVERSGGMITVESEVGVGTLFTILFPAIIFNDETSVDKEDKDTGIDNQQGNETILVVDDELPLLALCTEILTKNRYRVISAESGKKALEILEKESVDLLLSDVVMPGMNGYELAAIVQNKYPNIKIQMASGFTGEENKHNNNDNLHKNILHKPYRIDGLLTKVRELLD